MDKMRFRALMGQFPGPLLNFSVLKHIKVPMDGQFVGLFILSRLIVAGGGGATVVAVVDIIIGCIVKCE